MHARALTELWHRYYNAERSHSSLGDQTPCEFVEKWAREHGPVTLTVGDDLPATLARDPRPDLQLHTPGPANTSSSVRAAMLRDIGAWDSELIDLVAEIRRDAPRVCGVGKADGWEAVLVQGSGTFGVEATLETAVRRDGGLLVATNGAYGERMVSIARNCGIEVVRLAFDEVQPEDAEQIAAVVRRARADDGDFPAGGCGADRSGCSPGCIHRRRRGRPLRHDNRAAERHRGLGPGGPCGVRLGDFYL